MKILRDPRLVLADRVAERGWLEVRDKLFSAVGEGVPLSEYLQAARGDRETAVGTEGKMFRASSTSMFLAPVAGVSRKAGGRLRMLRWGWTVRAIRRVPKLPASGRGSRIQCWRQLRCAAVWPQLASWQVSVWRGRSSVTSERAGTSRRRCGSQTSCFYER